jgi:hypothetical protein
MQFKGNVYYIRINLSIITARVVVLVLVLVVHIRYKRSEILLISINEKNMKYLASKY